MTYGNAKNVRQNKIWCNQTPSIVFTIKKCWTEQVDSYNDYSMCEIKGKIAASCMNWNPPFRIVEIAIYTMNKFSAFNG